MANQTESSKPATDNLRNVRYCEIIPVTSDGITATSWVYNTLGLNYCPAAQWEALTEDEVNQEYGSIAAKLNGPRYWVIDRLEESGSSTSEVTFMFGGDDGIKMALRAKLETSATENTVGDEFYSPNEVERYTVFTYQAGKPVYELTSPDHEVYIMQSYSQIVDKDLTIEDLPSLGSKLSLPEGWRYSSRTLEDDFDLVTNGLAYVINDDLYNSYQRRTKRTNEPQT